jgi:hypothetical protein
MCTVYRLNTQNSVPDFIYKRTHEHHPLVKWCGESRSNFIYCSHLGYELYNEYQYRYNKPDKHQRAKQILDYFNQNHCAFCLPGIGLTAFVRAINKEKYPELHDKNITTVEAYRQYYIRDKRHLFKWTNRPVPDWIQNENK